MIPSKLLPFIVLLSTLIYWAASLWFNEATGALVLRINGVAVTAISLFIILFNHVFWKWPLINRWADRPILVGTWKGTYQSTYVHPDTQQTKGPVEAYFSITQTYTSLNVRFFTSESMSDSTTCEIKKDGSGRYAIHAVYVNTTKAGVRDKSAIHYGGLVLSIMGSVTALEGNYWTDRKTTGELVFDKRSRKVFDNFSSARRGTYQ